MGRPRHVAAANAFIMVNHLLTITIKDNSRPYLPNQNDDRGNKMKKVTNGRGFWSWLMGSGWSGTGGNG